MPSFSYLEIGDKPAIPATIIYFANFEEPERMASNKCGRLDTDLM